MVCILEILLFFKKKTAYEMRISDWSSDVCSSDLRPRVPPRKPLRTSLIAFLASPSPNLPRRDPYALANSSRAHASAGSMPTPVFLTVDTELARPEEHMSELQSLMRISYAVFCLIKKQNKFILSTRKCKTVQLIRYIEHH